MKKVLGLVVLMMVMLMSVAGLAVDVPVYLNVPAFVSLSLAEGEDGQFNWSINYTSEQSNLTDTITLEASANVSYTITPSLSIQVTNDTNSTNDWYDILNSGNINDLTLNSSHGVYVVYNPTNGTLNIPGEAVFNATASLEGYSLETLLLAGPIDQQVATITFTISSN